MNLQDSQVLEAGKVILADGRQVVAVQVTEKHQNKREYQRAERCVHDLG